MGRRANGEGTIYRLPNGRWRATVTVRIAGGLRRKSRTRRTQADARAALAELQGDMPGAIGDSDKMTLREFLLRWLENTVKPTTRPLSYKAYKRSVDLHIIPRLGSAKVLKLSPIHLEEFKAAMVADKVGPRAAQSAFAILRRALNHAVYPLRLIRANPCNGLKAPAHVRKEINPFTADEVRMILEDSKGSRWHAFYAVAFGCGLRAGELFALQWSDIDMKAGTLRIERQATDDAGHVTITKPKTTASIRTIDVPSFAAAALVDHRAVQMRIGLAASELLFPQLNGLPHCRANFYADEWRPRLTRCGLKQRGVHHARHTFATLTLLAGTDVAIVSKALGHSNPAITYKTYSHVLPATRKLAADAIHRLIG